MVVRQRQHNTRSVLNRALNRCSIHPASRGITFSHRVALSTLLYSAEELQNQGAGSGLGSVESTKKAEPSESNLRMLRYREKPTWRHVRSVDQSSGYDKLETQRNDYRRCPTLVYVHLPEIEYK